MKSRKRRRSELAVLYKAYQLKSDLSDRRIRQVFIDELQRLGIKRPIDQMTDKELLTLLAIERAKRQ